MNLVYPQWKNKMMKGKMLTGRESKENHSRSFKIRGGLSLVTGSGTLLAPWDQLHCNYCSWRRFDIGWWTHRKERLGLLFDHFRCCCRLVSRCQRGSKVQRSVRDRDVHSTTNKCPWAKVRATLDDTGTGCNDSYADMDGITWKRMY